MFRRTALLALAMTAALAPGALAASGGSQTLDGQRRTSVTYSGKLAGPTVYANAIGGDAELGQLQPHPSWCTSDTCHDTGLRLRLPAGRQSGRLVIELTKTAGPAQLHFVIYDDDGEPLPGQSSCCGSSRFVSTRMEKGDYDVYVYADAGGGSFDVDVTWKANPPHRTTPSSRG